MDCVMRRVLGSMAGFYVEATAASAGHGLTGTCSVHVNDPDAVGNDSVIASGSVADWPDAKAALDAAEAAGVQEVLRIVDLLVRHGGGWHGASSLESADCML